MLNPSSLPFPLPSYRFSVRNPLDAWPSWTGVKHGDELDYLLGRPLVQQDEFSETDMVLSAFMLKSWANFVKRGYGGGGHRRIVFENNYAKGTQFSDNCTVVSWNPQAVLLFSLPLHITC